jgi:hypothetical protein
MENLPFILSLTMASEKDIEDKEKELEKEIRRTKILQERLKSEASAFRKQFAKSTLTLMTSGFGLVSALAWNELIKEIVKEYVKPFFGESSGLISLAIYAIFITALAVLVTYQLSKLAEKK